MGEDRSTLEDKNTKMREMFKLQCAEYETEISRLQEMYTAQCRASSPAPSRLPRPLSREAKHYENIVAQWVPSAPDCKRLLDLSRPKRPHGRDGQQAFDKNNRFGSRGGAAKLRARKYLGESQQPRSECTSKSVSRGSPVQEYKQITSRGPDEQYIAQLAKPKSVFPSEP